MLRRDAIVSKAFSQSLLVEQAHITHIADAQLFTTADATRCVQRCAAILVIYVFLTAAIRLVVVIEAALDRIKRCSLHSCYDQR